jgi:predicted HTH transcriptional regulator
LTKTSLYYFDGVMPMAGGYKMMTPQEWDGPIESWAQGLDLAPESGPKSKLAFREPGTVVLDEVTTVDDFIRLGVACANRWEATWLYIGRFGFDLTGIPGIALHEQLRKLGMALHTQGSWFASVRDAAWDWRALCVLPTQRPVGYDGHYWQLVMDQGGKIVVQPVQPHELAAFFLERDDSWDSATCGCGWEAINLRDVAAMKFGLNTTATLTQAEAEAFLEKEGLIRQGRFTRAAVLLAGEKPQSLQHLYDCWARIGFGEDLGQSSAVKVLGGSLLWQYAQLMDLLPRYLGHELGETGPYTRGLLQEAIVNALAHRDYTAFGDVQVRVRPDRSQVVVSSTGGLPEGLVLSYGEVVPREIHPKGEEYPTRESPLYAQKRVLPVWRNPLIAHGLHLAGLMQARGEGLQMIGQRVLKRQAEITAVVTEDRFSMCFDDSAAKAKAERLSHFTERQRMILNWVEQHGSISNGKVRELVGCSDETARAEINVLVDQELLRSEGLGRAIRYVGLGR